MIQVTVVREPAERAIRAFKVTGHAGYADPGQDIVCAGVSAVAVGTVNAAEQVLGVELPADVRYDGYLAVQVPFLPDGKKRAELQLLLESMMVMLETIRQSYAGYIRITEKSATKEDNPHVEA